MIKTGIIRSLHFLIIGLVAFLIIQGPAGKAEAQQASLPDVIDSTQPKMVKIFGGGGLKRLEAWQSGFLISEDGLVVTARSYVLDSEPVIVFDDGRRMTATLVGYHPQNEIALLRVDVEAQPFFNLDNAALANNGSPSIAFSNLYGVANGNEQCSVQIGVVSAVMPLDARRGARKTNYTGPAIILDATTNNPGAAGGAVTDHNGLLMGMIGRESRSAASGLWLNYAIPARQISDAVEQILTGQSNKTVRNDRQPTEYLTLELMGLVLVPQVVDRTPPFVDQVMQDSAAETAGFRADDLIVEVDGVVTSSRKLLVEQLQKIDRDSTVSFLVQRQDEFLNLTLRVTGQ